MLLLWLIPFTLQAQVVEISNPGKLPAKASKFRVIGKNNDGIIVRLYGLEDVINVYTDELTLSTSKTIDFKNKDGLLQHIMLNKTGAVLFYLQQDRKYSVLFAQPVNSKFIEIGKPIAVDTIYDRRDLVEQNLRFKPSTDQNYLFIYYPFFAGNNVQTVRYICLDRALNKVYNTTLPFSRDEAEMESSKTLVDNNGASYLVLRKQDKEAGTTFDVYSVNSLGEPVYYSLHTDKKLFGEAYFDIDNKNGKLLLAALYDEELKKGEAVANGLLYATYEPGTGKEVQAVAIPFQKSFISELTGREVKDQGSLYTFNIKKAMLRNDGGMLLLAESFIKDTRESSVPIGLQPGYSSFQTTNLYQFNDIIGFSVSPKGEVDWSTIMRKKQVSEDDNGAFSSFLIMNQKDKLRLIYLDDVTNAGALNQYVLGSDGINERTTILNQEDKDVFLLPKNGRQIAPDALVVPSYKNGVLRLVKLTF